MVELGSGLGLTGSVGSPEQTLLLAARLMVEVEPEISQDTNKPITLKGLYSGAKSWAFPQCSAVLKDSTCFWGSCQVYSRGEACLRAQVELLILLRSNKPH